MNSPKISSFGSIVAILICLTGANAFAIDEKAAPHATKPAIDCPLRKHGVDPHALRPFAEVETYIEFLERPDRAEWQKPDSVVEALALSGNETIANLGAGSGYFSFRLAAAVPKGKVWAIDIEPEMIRHIHHKALTTQVSNIESVLTALDDPSVPEGTDLVFVCDVLHHVQEQSAWLKRLQGALRPGAKIALIEFREGELPQGPPEAMKISRPEILRLMNGAGFRLVSDHVDVLPYQHFLVFER
ncbi:MAG: SAM-dependent methyltransferase [Gemmatimonadetes bacterium]|nr:SAM-dependent methyltransferase [Gemmatimonadota bacterium]